MPIPIESIPVVRENLAHLADSLNKLHRADSIQQAIADSLYNQSLLPSGFEGIPLPENLNSYPLVTLSMMILFLLFSYILTFGRKTIFETTKDFFFVKERSSIFNESTLNALQFKGSLILIFIGTLGFFLYSLFFYSDTNISFSDRLHLLSIFFGLALLFLAFKSVVFSFLGYVFLDKNTTTVFLRAYFTVIFGMGLAFFPVVAGLIYAPPSMQIFFIVSGLIILVISFILVLYKIIQIFLINFYSLFYILLYLCALEILPVLIALKALS